MRLIKVSETRYDIVMESNTPDNPLVWAKISWRDYHNQSGYNFITGVTSRKSSRVLRPTLCESLMKSARFTAKEADDLIATLTE